MPFLSQFLSTITSLLSCYFLKCPFFCYDKIYHTEIFMIVHYQVLFVFSQVLHIKCSCLIFLFLNSLFSHHVGTYITMQKCESNSFQCSGKFQLNIEEDNETDSHCFGKEDSAKANYVSTSVIHSVLTCDSHQAKKNSIETFPLYIFQFCCFQSCLNLRISFTYL